MKKLLYTFLQHRDSDVFAVNRDSSEEGGETKDTSNEPCVCDICGKTLKHQKSLYSHRRTHTDSKAVCHICGTTLKSSRYLHHHLLLHKNVEKPHKCDKCEKAFFSSSALKGKFYLYFIQFHFKILLTFTSSQCTITITMMRIRVNFNAPSVEKVLKPNKDFRY